MLPILLWLIVPHVYAGYKRTIADLKSTGRMALHEGREAIRIDGYRMLASKFAIVTPSDGNNS